MGKILAAIIGVAGLFVVIVLISLLLIKIGWGLFMVPVFGLADLTWMQALGFSLLAAAFKPSSYSKKE